MFRPIAPKGSNSRFARAQERKGPGGRKETGQARIRDVGSGTASLSIRIGVLAATAGLAGCLFDSTFKIRDPGPTATAQVLDTVVASGTAARIVTLYQPVLDPALKPGASAPPEISKPVKVKTFADSGRIVEYRHTRQRFGSWSPEREFAWNWYQLQANWLFPKSLPDTAGLGTETPGLYERLHGEDRFTRYYDSASAPGIWGVINSSTRPGAVGVMVRANAAGDTVQIRYVVPDSPADRAGLAEGMSIVAVDDSAVTGDSSVARFARFNSGDSGSAVRLTVSDPGGGTFTRSLVRVPVAFPTVLADTLDGVGHLAILGFTPNTIGEKSTWTELREGLAATRGLPVTILDLRDNGGGALDVAMRMCDEILPEGAVIIREVQRRFDEMSRAPIETEIVTRATAGGAGERAEDGKPRLYLLLADTGSASASEIFLVALREGAGAPLMGQTTFGKGVGQTVRGTPGKGLSLITFLKFKSAAGLEYHKKGLKPDIPDSAFGDALLAHAVAKAKEMAGMPAAKRGALDKGSAARAAAAEWNRRQAVRKGGE